MKEIYLISHTPNDRVKNIKVCELEFLNFNLNLDEFNALVVTSKNSIKALEFNNIKPSNIKLFSIGEPTTKVGLKFGFVDIYTASSHHGDEFANEILPFLKGKKVLFLRAKDVVSKIDEILTKNKIRLTTIITYENKFISLSEENRPPKGSILIFTSPSNVKGFLKNYNIDESYTIVSIGKATSKELKNYKNVITSPFQDINECINLAKTL